MSIPFGTYTSSSYSHRFLASHVMQGRKGSCRPRIKSLSSLGWISPIFRRTLPWLVEGMNEAWQFESNLLGSTPSPPRPITAMHISNSNRISMVVSHQKPRLQSKD
ncbi:unnamed protein product [Nesidiocoris tenuis]|uniref:Uncharacterized protein n=1 Tax=Nesidiocoris tenuis TaxID=355587 RepID=A0A6H5HKR9_9HEMI|nr:unnamed protein product [Nesidiocoris tenuis]